MKMDAVIKEVWVNNHPLIFRNPAGTSRGILTEKPSRFIFIRDAEGNTGIGECSIIPGLSIDPIPLYEEKLLEVLNLLKAGALPGEMQNIRNEFPSIYFGLEVAWRDFLFKGKRMIFDTPFYSGKRSIPINGLIWMGNRDFMMSQVREKIAEGFNCIKLKIGALNFDEELKILKAIREIAPLEDVEIRVDANGAFSPADAEEKLAKLAQFHIHSVEQPIRQGQWEAMRDICKNSPIPVALDEELLGIGTLEMQRQMLDFIKPPYIILKPSLIGGLEAADNWVEMAEERNIGWWATSALEANIGLNAIAQWADNKNVTMPQGLGTGKLFTNNIESPLTIDKGSIHYNKKKKWDLEALLNA